MAINLNRSEIIGNLTRDPELRYTPNGQAVASFAVATNRRYPDKSGNWVDAEPEFHEIVAWAKLGEGANQALKKGDRVYISGRLQTRSWEGQDGSRRSRTELVADTILGPDQVGRASFQSAQQPMVAQPAAPASANATATPAAPASVPTDAPAAPTKSDDSDSDDIKIEDIPF